MFELVEVSDHGLTLYTERTDGIGGFPGNLKIWISYHLEETGAYEISYKVTTDQDTLVNPTNHSYFNLSGDFTKTIDRHVFQLKDVYKRQFYIFISFLCKSWGKMKKL